MFVHSVLFTHPAIQELSLLTSDGSNYKNESIKVGGPRFLLPKTWETDAWDQYPSKPKVTVLIITSFSFYENKCKQPECAVTLCKGLWVFRNIAWRVTGRDMRINLLHNCLMAVAQASVRFPSALRDGSGLAVGKDHLPPANINAIRTKLHKGKV